MNIKRKSNHSKKVTISILQIIIVYSVKKNPLAPLLRGFYFIIFNKRLLLFFDVVHHLSNLCFRRFSTHRHEHRSYHVFIDRWIFLHLAFDEPTSDEESSETTYDEEDDHKHYCNPKFHLLYIPLS